MDTQEIVDIVVQAYAESGIEPKQLSPRGDGTTITAGCGMDTLKAVYPDVFDELDPNFRGGFMNGFDGAKLHNPQFAKPETLAGREAGVEAWEAVKDGVPVLV